MALYYDDLWKIRRVEIEQAVRDGLLKEEDMEKTIAYYRQWFDWPGWSVLVHEGKNYYRSPADRLIYFGMCAMLSSMAVLFLFTAGLFVVKLIK